MSGQDGGRVVGLVLSDEDVDEREIERTLARQGAHVLFLSGMFARFNKTVDVLAPGEVPPPAWLEQARRNAVERSRFLEEFGALDPASVAELAGSRSANRRALAQRWRAEGRISGVEVRGRYLYLGFQFDRTTGQPKPAVGRVLQALPVGLRRGGWQLALWWGDALDILGWRRPVDLLGEDPETVVAAAEAEAAEWAEAGTG